MRNKNLATDSATRHPACGVLRPQGPWTHFFTPHIPRWSTRSKKPEPKQTRPFGSFSAVLITALLAFSSGALAGAVPSEAWAPSGSACDGVEDAHTVNVEEFVVSRDETRVLQEDTVIVADRVVVHGALLGAPASSPDASGTSLCIQTDSLQVTGIVCAGSGFDQEAGIGAFAPGDHAGLSGGRGGDLALDVPASGVLMGADAVLCSGDGGAGQGITAFDPSFQFPGACTSTASSALNVTGGTGGDAGDLVATRASLGVFAAAGASLRLGDGGSGGYVALLYGNYGGGNAHGGQGGASGGLDYPGGEFLSAGTGGTGGDAISVPCPETPTDALELLACQEDRIHCQSAPVCAPVTHIPDPKEMLSPQPACSPDACSIKQDEVQAFCAFRDDFVEPLVRETVVPFVEDLVPLVTGFCEEGGCDIPENPCDSMDCGIPPVENPCDNGDTCKPPPVENPCDGGGCDPPPTEDLIGGGGCENGCGGGIEIPDYCDYYDDAPATCGNPLPPTNYCHYLDANAPPGTCGKPNPDPCVLAGIPDKGGELPCGTPVPDHCDVVTAPWESDDQPLVCDVGVPDACDFLNVSDGGGELPCGIPVPEPCDLLPPPPSYDSDPVLGLVCGYGVPEPCSTLGAPPTEFADAESPACGWGAPDLCDFIGSTGPADHFCASDPGDCVGPGVDVASCLVDFALNACYFPIFDDGHGRVISVCGTVDEAGKGPVQGDDGNGYSATGNEGYGGSTGEPGEDGGKSWSDSGGASASAGTSGFDAGIEITFCDPTPATNGKSPSTEAVAGGNAGALGGTGGEAYFKGGNGGTAYAQGGTGGTGGHGGNGGNGLVYYCIIPGTVSGADGAPGGTGKDGGRGYATGGTGGEGSLFGGDGGIASGDGSQGGNGGNGGGGGTKKTHWSCQTNDITKTQCAMETVEEGQAQCGGIFGRGDVAEYQGGGAGGGIIAGSPGTPAVKATTPSGPSGSPGTPGQTGKAPAGCAASSLLDAVLGSL